MIAQQEIENVAAYVNEHGLSEHVIQQLRNSYPGKHFTWCMEDDINVGKPVHEEKLFAIYLVDSRDHCSKLTNDGDCASGFVLAEYYQDDD